MNLNILGYTYEVEDKSNGRTVYKITPDKSIETPSTLWKLYSLNENSISSLIEQYVWASHPDTFNDLFDCYEGFIDFDSDLAIKTFLSPSLSKDVLNKIFNLDKNLLKAQTQFFFREILYSSIGVLSLTNNPNNIMMWSYYTSHRGFAIEYDYSKFPFPFFGPFPINYQDELKPISISKYGGHLSFLYHSNIKYSGWKHEDEWRILVNAEKESMKSPISEYLKIQGQRDRKFYFPSDAIKSILLGNKFFDPEEIYRDKNIFHINILNNQNLKANIIDFAYSNKIKLCLAMRQNDFIGIFFVTGQLEKVDDLKYKFIAL